MPRAEISAALAAFLDEAADDDNMASKPGQAAVNYSERLFRPKFGTKKRLGLAARLGGGQRIVGDVFTTFFLRITRMIRVLNLLTLSLSTRVLKLLTLSLALLQHYSSLIE